MEEVKKLILVFYIDVRPYDVDDIEDFMYKIGNKLNLDKTTMEVVLIPILGETKVECINPVYITDSELIKKHERLMAELHEHLENQIKTMNLTPKNNG